MDKYQVIIYWSDEDAAFIAEVPELPGCMAHGDSRESALTQVGAATELWLQAAKELDRPIPKPKGRRLLFA